MKLTSLQSSTWIRVIFIFMLSDSAPTKQSSCTADCSSKILDPLSKERDVTRAIKYRHKAIAYLFNIKFKKVEPIKRPLLEMEAVIRQKLGDSQEKKSSKADADMSNERKRNKTAEDTPIFTTPNSKQNGRIRAEFVSDNSKLEDHPGDISRAHQNLNPAASRKSAHDAGVPNISSPLVKCSHVRDYSGHRWIYQVVECPRSWTNATIRKLCEYWDHRQLTGDVGDVVLLPVQDDAGMVYANVYCGVCNGVKRIHPWEKFLRCDTDLTKENVKWPMVDDLVPGKMGLRNPDDCHNSILPWSPESIVDCTASSVHDKRSLMRSANLHKQTPKVATNFPVSFNMLLNFDFTGNGHLIFSAGQSIVEDGEDMCGDSETYDTYTNRCRPISCSRTHHLENGQCVALGDNQDNRVTWYDDVDQLPLLEDIAFVTLMANITFGDYVLYALNVKEAAYMDEVKQMILESLNITADRMSHLNISFEFGSMEGSAVQVNRLTKEEYERLLSQDQSDDLNVIGEMRSKGASGPGAPSSEPSQSSDSSTHNTLTLTTREPDSSTARPENSGQKMDGEVTRRASSHESDLDLDPDTTTRSPSQDVEKEEASPNWSGNAADVSEREIGLDETKAADDDEDHAEGVKSRRRAVVSNVKEKGFYEPVLLRPTIKNSKEKIKKRKKGKHEGTWEKLEELEKFSDYLSKLDTDLATRSASDPQRTYKLRLGDEKSLSFRMVVGDNDTEEVKVFLSEPYNGAQERIVLRSSVDDAANQPMVMVISFVLLPSDNPEEQKSRKLAEKITELVIERELHLEFSGKDITVVDSKNMDENDIDDTGDNFCRWGKTYMVFNDEFSIVNVGNDTLLYVNKTDSYNPIGMFDLWVMISGNNIEDETNFTLFRQYAFVCLMPQIKQHDCRRIEVTKDEYRVIGNNRSIIFEEKEYDIYSYKLLNETSGSIAICVPKGYDVYKQKNLMTIENGCGSEFLDVMRADGYLTLILGRLSVAALVLVLITYCLFKKFRNLPGINTINLTLTLLIAQVVFTEGIVASPPWLCSAVAIIEHFTRLAAQFWMNVISYDVYQTFSKPTVSTLSRNKRKTFIKYNLYAWGVPLLIVGICALIDFSDLFPGVSIGYGGNNGISHNSEVYTGNSTDQDPFMAREFQASYDNMISPKTDSSNETSDLNLNLPYTKATCWIGNSLATLLAFGAPIFIILITNCYFFVRTIINISHTSKSSKSRLTQRSSDSSSVGNTTGRADVMLYIRMSTVMGLTWVFAFTWSVASSFAKVHTKAICIVVLSQGILSTIFNVSQGIFIFVAFVCNRRVFSLYKDLFARLRKKFLLGHPKSRLNSRSSDLSSTCSVNGTCSLSSSVTRSSTCSLSSSVGETNSANLFSPRA